MSVHCKKISVGNSHDLVLRFLDVSYPARRVYWLSGPSQSRGFHAHKSLYQTLICVSGQIQIMFSDGESEEILTIQEGEAFEAGPGLWREIYPLREGDKLLVLASEEFSESDYIRNYQEFLDWRSDA